MNTERGENVIYDKIVSLCAEKGRSVRSVEKEAGISYGSIAKWNASAPSVYSIAKVAKILKVSIEKLIEEE